MTALISGARVLAERLAAHAALADPDDPAQPPDLPDYVVQALARMRLLIGVPFGYLLPDPALLPPESARFFHLDPAWLDQLCTGALAVGAGGTREQAQAQLALAPVRAALDRHLPLVRDLSRGRLVLEDALADATSSVDIDAPVTGVLIRSALVSGWPGLQLRAYTTDDPGEIPPGADPATLPPGLAVPVLRFERLDPAVLLVLFAGLPRLIWLEEPHHGVQFGVDDSSGTARVPVRAVTGVETGRVPVPFRGAPADGVVDIAALAAALDAAGPLAHPRGSAALALSLLAPPARKRFGASTEVHP